MKKKLMILLLIICTGCTANYNIKINKDMSVEETIIGLEDESFYSRYYNSSKERIVNFVIVTEKDYLNEKNYKFSIVDNDTSYGGKVTKKYKSIEDYFKNSKAYAQYFEDWQISDKNGIITISLDKKMRRNGNSLDRYTVDKGKVTIQLPFKVIKNNADKVEGKMYTWNMNSYEGDKIYIKFKYDEQNKGYNNLIAISVLLSILVVVVVGIIIFIKRMKKSRKI